MKFLAQLKLKNINKIFGRKQVLKNITMEINEGEILSLLGPSGCGKTTLLRIISGLLTPDEGQVFFNGEDYTLVDSNKRNAVIVFQDYGLFPHMTISENIEFGLKVRKINKSERDKKIKEMLKLVQLEDKWKNYPSELSGGQKQRVALARALIISPKVLLLDEPFSNLDANLKEDMREFVLELQKKLEITMILVTHDKEEAFMVSDKVAVIMEGQLKQFGTPAEIYKKPLTKELSDFIGEANYIEGKVENAVLKSIVGDFITESKNNDKVIFRVRYDEIELSREKSEVYGTIVTKKYGGRNNLYSVVLGKGVDVKVSSTNSSFEIGDTVYLRININYINIY